MILTRSDWCRNLNVLLIDELHHILQNDVEQTWTKYSFLHNIVFPNESTFTLKGEGSRHNCRYWSVRNLYWMLNIHAQYPQIVVCYEIFSRTEHTFITLEMFERIVIHTFLLGGHGKAVKTSDLFGPLFWPLLIIFFGDY